MKVSGSVDKYPERPICKPTPDSGAINHFGTTAKDFEKKRGKSYFRALPDGDELTKLCDPIESDAELPE